MPCHDIVNSFHANGHNKDQAQRNKLNIQNLFIIRATLQNKLYLYKLCIYTYSFYKISANSARIIRGFILKQANVNKNY